MTSKTESTSDQSSELDAPITLTPDQIAEVAGGAALTAVSPCKPPPTIFGFIGPVIPEKPPEFIAV